jgi:hypothetical protein
MNDFRIAQTRFSLTALRDNKITDEAATPPFSNFCCLRHAASPRAAGIFIESLGVDDGALLDACALEFGLVIHQCPSDFRWSVLTRASDQIIWPRSAQEVQRRKERRVR